MNEPTKKDFPFTVESEHFDSTEEKITAKSIIEQAKEKGIPAAQGKVENLVIECKGVTCSGDDLIDLSQDNEFSIKIIEEEVEERGIYRFKVNGQELESNSDKLVALDIINIAQEKGIPLPDKPENLLLQIVGEAHEFKVDNWVALEGFPEFLLIPNTPTQVA